MLLGNIRIVDSFAIKFQFINPLIMPSSYGGLYQVEVMSTKMEASLATVLMLSLLLLYSNAAIKALGPEVDRL